MSEPTSEIALPAKKSAARQRRRKAPRDPAAQSRRDLAIFKKVEIERFSHAAAAQRFGLHKSRVTQIVQQVRRQLAEVRGDDEQIESHLAQQRLRRAMEKLRLEFALAAATKALRRDPPKLVTRRTGTRDNDGAKVDWTEVVTRDQPANLQLLKTFLRVTHDLGRLNDRDIANNPIGQSLTTSEMFQAIVDLLSEWQDGQSWRDDPPSDAFFALIQAFEKNIRTWLFRFRQGASAHDAWPPEINQSAGNHSLGENGINHQPQKTNHGLTASAAGDASAITVL